MNDSRDIDEILSDALEDERGRRPSGRPPSRRPPSPVRRPFRVRLRPRFSRRPEPFAEPPAEPLAPQGSEHVRWIQSALNAAMALRLPIDGVMDPATRSAVRSFQERSKLPADGIVGPDTERALMAARTQKPAGEPAPEEELSGTGAPSVRWIQQALNQVLGMRLTVDGAMGPATRAAIRSFQQKHDLVADGVVGPATERALVAAGAPSLPAAAAPVLAPASATTLLVRGVGLTAAPALNVTNFLDPRVARLVAQTRPGRTVTELIVHETVTWSHSGTVRVLQERKLGVHLILGPDGAFTQHGDLGDDITYHAGNSNGRSVGIEVVNPVLERHFGTYKRMMPRGKPLPWTRTIPAGWVEGGSYILPTPAQAEALVRLIAWITSPAALGLSIPRRWTGVADGRFEMRRVPGTERSAPGISAHSHSSAPKQDGPWLVLYAWLRLEAGLPAGEAYEEAAQRAAIQGTSVALGR